MSRETPGEGLFDAASTGAFLGAVGGASPGLARSFFDTIGGPGAATTNQGLVRVSGYAIQGVVSSGAGLLQGKSSEGPLEDIATTLVSGGLADRTVRTSEGSSSSTYAENDILGAVAGVLLGWALGSL